MDSAVGIASLFASVVTAVAATYLALLALRHSAKPRIDVIWQRGSRGLLRPSMDTVFIFDVFNTGHWYAKPIARDIVISFDCPDFFDTARLLRRGVGGILEAEAKSSGTKSEVNLTSLPFTLFAGEQTKFAIEVTWWKNISGNGDILVRVQSLEGASYKRRFDFEFDE
jgi:hypothetical protein